MVDLLGLGTDRGYSMIGVGLSATLSGGRKARVNLDPMPALDLNFAANRSLPADYGPTPSFSRASTGTFFNSSGVLTSAAVNVPRFDHVLSGGSWVSRGLLVEEQRTNLFQQSEDFSNAYWTKDASSITANSIAAPDGNTTADKIVEDTQNRAHAVVRDFTITAGTVYTLSVFAKAGERTWVTLNLSETGVSDRNTYFNLSDGTIGTNATGNTATITPVGNGWYRCSASRTVSVSNPRFFIELASADGTRSYVGDGSSGAYFWGAQLEGASSFPTSYIPTTSASATRSADVCQITGGHFSGFWNGTEGSVACEFDVSSGYTSSAMTIVNFYQSGSSWIGFRSIESTSNNVFDCYSGGVQQARLGFSRSNPGISARLAAAFKANDFAASQNGSAVLTDTSGSLPSPTYLELGTFTGFGEYLNGHIARLRYYPTRLTNAKLQELST